MSGRGNSGQRELVFCHQCEDEWYKDLHGLTCPHCRSEVVEIIDPDNDPREDHHLPIGPDDGSSDTHPFHDHHPWDSEPHARGGDAPDPDEGDISHMEWSGPGGIHFSRTTYTSTGPGGTFTRVGGGSGPPMGFDAFAPMLQGLLGPGMMNNAQQQRRGGQEGNGPRGPDARPPGWAYDPSGSRPPRMSGTLRMNIGPHATTHAIPMDDIAGIFGSILHGVGPPGGNARAADGGLPQPGGPLSLLHQLFNPANARMGDAVYSNEALDRVISQLMEQHSGSSAPGPASDAAISGLPKFKITKEHQDNEGKAECSICMESVNLGEEVMELPCKHWFHEACVSAWLHEHDTCPQCRRGITPKEGDANTPRQTGEPPRFWQFSENELRRSQSNGPQTPTGAGPSAGPSGMYGSGTASSPFQVPESPSPAPSSSPSRNRNEGGRGFASSITGWMGRMRHGSGGTGSGGDTGNNH